jgi:hypothetical protein
MSKRDFLTDLLKSMGRVSKSLPYVYTPEGEKHNAQMYIHPNT